MKQKDDAEYSHRLEIKKKKFFNKKNFHQPIKFTFCGLICYKNKKKIQKICLQLMQKDEEKMETKKSSSKWIMNDGQHITRLFKE